jgi:hypothetical protein
MPIPIEKVDPRKFLQNQEAVKDLCSINDRVPRNMTLAEYYNRGKGKRCKSIDEEYEEYFGIDND